MNKSVNEYLAEFAIIADAWFQDNQFVNTHSEWFANFFKKNNLDNVVWTDIQELGKHLHAFGTNALARANAFGKPNYEIEVYRKSFNYLANGEGSEIDRMREFYKDNLKFSSKYLGPSALSEIIGNLFPDKFIFMNARDKEAAQFLGYQPDFKRGDDFATRFEKFNTTLAPLFNNYKSIVGSRHNLPIGLQVDQFLSWIYVTYVPEKTKSNNSKTNYQIWKISHGKSADMSDKDHQTLLEHNLVAVGFSDPDHDSKSQGEKFKTKIKSGDYFYLVRQAQIVLWGKFIGEDCLPVPEGFTNSDWIAREVIMLKESNFPSKNLSLEYQAKAGWQPSYTSTVFEIPAKEFESFQKGILSPVFDLSLPDSNVVEEAKLKDSLLPKIYFESKNNIPLNQIMYGPPGTGKTYNTVKEALKILENIIDPIGSYEDQKERFDSFKSNGQIDFVTFHQSFSYEDFVEGIRADTKNNNIQYKVEPGVFKKLVEKAQADTSHPYILIIDEINRGNTSKIFGELITLIEDSKREGKNERIEVTLPYSGKKFSIPKNIFIIGTMNTADRSLALMDTALRRRFDFIETMPDPATIKDKNGQALNIDGINIPELLKVINQRIEALYDREHTIGHAFFLELHPNSTINDLGRIFKNKILPLLEEYFFEDWEKITKVLGKSGIYEEKKFENLGFDHPVKNYIRVTSKLLDPKTYIAIYTNKYDNIDIN